MEPHDVTAGAHRSRRRNDVRRFLRRRSAELLRFAFVVCGDRSTAEALVEQATLRTFADLGDRDEPNTWANAARVWTVRGFLSEGMQLGAAVAADVDSAVEPAESAESASGLVYGVNRSSKLQRTVLVLHYREHFSETEIADLVGSSEAGIVAYIGALLERLDVSAPGQLRTYPEQELRRVLHVLGTDLDSTAELCARIIAALPRPVPSGPSEAEIAAAERAAADAAREAADLQALVVEISAGTAAEVAEDVVETLPAADPSHGVQVAARPYASQKIVRPLVVVTTLLGINYLVWRWGFSVHWAVWWISVPLVIAETHTLMDTLLFGVTMWRLRNRPDPGPPPVGATVDVFITTYNEPIDLVMTTAHAAQRITYPHTLWILDDGNRPELKELAEAEGIGVISRSSDWIDMPRNAKAGNLNNALMVTQGEFVVILDADQTPVPELLDRTLGYFTDAKMAIVQTPHCFVNGPRSKRLDSRTALFYRPIQPGMDGWDSALFCGSNAVLRREALLPMGVRRYVLELELRIQDALDTAEKVIRQARSALPADDEKVSEALTTVLEAAQQVRDELDQGVPTADATARFQNLVRKASRDVGETGLAASQADLAELFDLIGDEYVESPATALNAEALDRLARRDWSPLGAIETVRALIAAVDVDREDQDETPAIMPMSTISVAEDLATGMRIHGMGWKSAFHDEIVAVGRAPESLATMLTHRRYRAQGTVQAVLRANPLRQKGLSFAQRLVYLGPMWSYLSGFAALVYIAAPVIFLVSGVLPVDALSAQLFARLVPFLVIDQVLFVVIGRGRSTWRAQHYSFALFPVWIRAVASAVGSVVFGRSFTFAVTPKTRVRLERRPWRLLWPQLLAMVLLIAAAADGITRYYVDRASGLATIVNLVWVAVDLALVSAIPRALFYRGSAPGSDEPAPPAQPARPLTVPETRARV